jgi:hypothetical protein
MIASIKLGLDPLYQNIKKDTTDQFGEFQNELNKKIEDTKSSITNINSIGTNNSMLNSTNLSNNISTQELIKARDTYQHNAHANIVAQSTSSGADLATLLRIL